MNVNVTQADMQGMMNRLMRLARLDTTVFDEVRLDPGATIPSLVVMAASTFLAGLGGLLYWMITLNIPSVPGVSISRGTGAFFLKSTIMGSVFAIALWVAWVLLVYIILTQLFKEQADAQQLLRTMGMAAIPLALTFFMFIPQVDFGIGLISLALLFGLTTVAIQAATKADVAKVLVANTAGFAVWALVLTLLAGNISLSGNGLSPNIYAPGIFSFGASFGGYAF
ncbi:MAG: hypothetical protein ABSG55_02840 [Dehalococcoidia bacterium]|jgi:hypothetical protein